MSSRLSKLEEVATIVDSLHKTPGYIETGHPMVRVTDVKYGFLDLSKALRVNEDTFLEFSRRYKPSKADIIVTRVGTYGVFSKVLDTHFCLGQNTAAIIPNQIDADYLYAALNSSFVRAQIEASVVGSTQKTLSLRLIGKLEIPRLEEKYELLIAELSSYLDNRITLLRETNSTLEAIAQALFKSWFVDFDPVRAKQEGRQPEGLDEATAALFPDSFEQSELGEIPKGWASNVIKELLNRPTISRRFTKAQVLKHGETPVYEQGASILLGYHNDVPTCKASPENPMFIFGDHTCVTKLSCQPFDISQNVILLNGSIRNTIWTYYAIHGKQKFEEYRRHWMELIVKNVVVPPQAICNHFAEIILPLQLSIEANEKTIQTLSDLRDTLLPRLISGQLRLPDAEEQIEAATA